MNEYEIIVKDRLRNIKNNNLDYIYDIEDSKERWYLYLKYCTTKKEKLQIMMCLYMIHPSCKELQQWNVEKYINYVIETDDCYTKDFYNNLLN